MKGITISQLASIEPVSQGSENSYLVNRINELIALKVEQLEVEDLRKLISQNIALDIIVPAAIEILEKDPFAEGDYYKGDLLKSVLSIDDTFWQIHGNLKDKLKVIASCFEAEIKKQYLSGELSQSIKSLFNDFYEK